MCCSRIGLSVNRRSILLGLAITVALLALNFVMYLQQFSPPAPASVSLMERIERRMYDRRHLLATKCHDYGLDQRRNDSQHRPNSLQMLVNRPHHLIYCNVFKAASTSWLYNFNLLAGYDPVLLNASTNQVTLARRKYRRVSPAALSRAQSDSLSFLIVRHPFERLVSAYRDKIVNPENTYWAKLGRVIIFVYRLAFIAINSMVLNEEKKTLSGKITYKIFLFNFNLFS